MRGTAIFGAALAGWLLAACSPGPPDLASPLGRDHPLNGRILATATGAFVDAETVIAAASEADFVLLGEKHDNPDHHALQAWVVQQVVAGGRRSGLAFEMISDDQADALAAWLATGPRDPRGLGPAIGWERTGWPPWELYAPIAGAVLGRSDRIVAANLGRERTRAIGTAGLAALDPAEQARFALDRPLEEAARAGIAAAVRDGHCGMLPEAQIPRMVAVQEARDGRMAAGLLDAAAGLDTGILIAGAEHARRDRGVPRRLAVLAPGRRIVTVGFVETDASRTRARDYPAATAFDFLWFTPRISDEDPCARLAEQLRRRQAPSSRP